MIAWRYAIVIFGAFSLGATRLPAWNPNEDIIEHLQLQPNHKVFVSALRASGFLSKLKGPGRFTLLAPNDAAFARLPKGMMDKLLSPDYRPQLIQLIGCHIVASEIKFNSFGPIGTPTATTVGGCVLRFARKEGDVFVTDENNLTAKLVRYDVFESNGEFEELDAVLTPRVSSILKRDNYSK